MGQVQLVKRPRCWDTPFAPARLPEKLVETILAGPVFRDIDAHAFPDDLALRDILANDARVLQFSRGAAVYRQGTYGTSLYAVLKGSVSASPVNPDRSSKSVAADNPSWASWLKPLRSLSSRPDTGTGHSRGTPLRTDRLPHDRHGPGDLFGELEALRRTPRHQTICADTDDTVLLEIRWPGVRELRYWSDDFRAFTDSLYERRAIETGLQQCPLLRGIDAEAIQRIAGKASFERYGDFDWTHGFQKAAAQAQDIIDREPVIVAEGDYLEDLLVLCVGTARVTKSFGRGEKTVGVLTAGDVFGLQELLGHPEENARGGAVYGLRAAGYAEVIRIPSRIFTAHIQPALMPRQLRESMDQGLAADTSGPLLEFVVDRRLVNGAEAMLIDTDKCVHCDDCVRACAATHGGKPRFTRNGPVQGTTMFATACMHCNDPVCMIDCPTDAIRRTSGSVAVVIDDAACIGCGTCAAACPYGNITMEEVRNEDGAYLIDQDGEQILRATKCDLCAGRDGGPACRQACPHGALSRAAVNSVVARAGRLADPH